MKNIYMFQPNYMYGNQAHLPYAIATLAAFAWHEPEIKENYELKKIQFLREDINKVVEELDEPFIAAFSTYMWNYGYNTSLAEKIKEAYPECIIIFGGHQITPDNSMLNELAFVDIVIQGEGEEPFLRLLRSYIGLDDFEKIPNIAYKKGGKIIAARREYYDYYDYPSPYLEGTFDKIMAGYPQISFVFQFETNRGCPYHCAYCDWGTLKGKMRMFPEERTLAEFDWMAEHKMDFCGNADSNFGLFDRDLMYIDKLIELNRKTGYPKKFQASYAKNNSKRIFEIGRKLNDCNMCKGITLAFQSLSEEALSIIGRTNISLQFFKELMSLYNEVNIPTYTELILGLPGETYDSFADGINSLLCAGQHQSIYIHNCELLPGSDLGAPEFVEKYKIKSRIIPLNLPHMSCDFTDSIPEYSNIVTSTFSMSEEDWVKTNLFSDVVQCFHHLGTFQLFAIYCNNELGIAYRDFYEKLIEFIFENKNTFVFGVINDIKNRYEAIINGCGELTAYCEKYGNVKWSFDEFSFIRLIENYSTVFEELNGFLESLGIKKEIFTQLLKYQIFVLKKPGDNADNRIECDYDFCSYFNSVFLGEEANLICKKTVFEITGAETYNKIDDYARHIVWYGRKDSKNIYNCKII